MRLIANYAAATLSASGRGHRSPRLRRRSCVGSAEEDWTPCEIRIDRATRQALDDYLKATGGQPGQSLFAGRRTKTCMTTRQYAPLLSGWLAAVGLDLCSSVLTPLRRTKATLIYKRTGNLRAVQLLLVHRKMESTVVFGHRSRRRYRDIRASGSLTKKAGFLWRCPSPGRSE